MEAEQIIKSLNDIASPAVQEIVRQYSRWFFVSSLGWILAGIGSLVIAGKIWNKNFDDYDSNLLIPVRVICVSAIIISVLVIFANLPTILCPTAYSIHQLLEDVRGK